MPVMSSADVAGQFSPLLLTNHIQKEVPLNLGWNAAAPVVTTDKMEGTVFGFDNKTSSTRQDTRKGDGTAASDFSIFVGNQKYDLVKHELKGKIPAEVLKKIDVQGIPVDLQRATVWEAWERIRYNRALELAELITNPNSFGTNNKDALSGTSKFGGTASALREIAKNAKGVIKLNTKRANVEAFVAYDAFLAALEDPLFLDAFKYTTAPTDLVGDSKAAKDLADFWKIDKVTVSEMVITDPSTQAESYVGSGCVLFAYVDPSEDLYVKSFAKTYQLKDYPQADMPYQDKETSEWKFPVITYEQSVITFADAGYLVTGCV